MSELSVRRSRPETVALTVRLSLQSFSQEAFPNQTRSLLKSLCVMGKVRMW